MYIPDMCAHTVCSFHTRTQICMNIYAYLYHLTEKLSFSNHVVHTDIPESIFDAASGAEGGDWGRGVNTVPHSPRMGFCMQQC